MLGSFGGGVDCMSGIAISGNISSGGISGGTITLPCDLRITATFHLYNRFVNRRGKPQWKQNNRQKNMEEDVLVIGNPLVLGHYGISVYNIICVVLYTSSRKQSTYVARRESPVPKYPGS